MITAPTRRLWLYPTPDGALEIVILGDDESVATMYARVRQLAESWRGFDRVSALGQSGAVVGVRVTIAPMARNRDPVREAMYALRVSAPDLMQAISWLTVDLDGATVEGMVGTW